MKKFVTHLLVIWLITITQFASGDTITTVAKDDYNLNPSLAYNAADDEYLVVWTKSKKIIGFDEGQIFATLYKSKNKLKKIKTVEITRPSTNKIFPPMLDVYFHPGLKTYYVVWYEVKGETRNILVSTLDTKLNFIKRSLVLRRKAGVILNPPKFTPHQSGEFISLVWGELAEGKFASQVLTFLANDPKSSQNFTIEIDSSTKIFELPMVILEDQDQGFYILGLMFKQKKGVHKAIYKRQVDIGSSSVSKRTKITSRDTKSSTTIAGALSEDKALIAFDQVNKFSGASRLAAFSYDLESKKKIKAGADTSDAAIATEVFITAPICDSYNRMVWIEKTADTYSIWVQAIDEKGMLFGERFLIASSANAMSDLAIKLGNNGHNLFVCWSENYREENETSVHLKAKLLNLNDIL